MFSQNTKKKKKENNEWRKRIDKIPKHENENNLFNSFDVKL